MTPSGRLTAVVLPLTLGAVGAVGLVAASPPARVMAASTPPHIMLIVDENAAYNAAAGSPYIIGNSKAPYINSLASQYASATSWYSPQHTSYHDYIDLLSGSNQSCCSTPYTAPTVVDELTGAGISWTAYMESMPSACYNGKSTGEYDKGHNPFASFASTSTAPECNNVVPYSQTQMSTDLASTTPPDFVWVTPNLCDDMHSKCTTNRIAQGDTWLKNNLPTVLASQWYADNGVVIITWDESTSSDISNGGISGDSGGHIATVVISANSKGAGPFTGLGDHFGTLKGIEDAYGVGCLANSCSGHGDLSGAWNTTPGTIDGTVTDASTTNPLEGATVSCTCSGMPTTTGTGGAYTFSSVPPGTYSLTFSDAGYVSQTMNNITVDPGGTTTVNAALTAGTTPVLVQDVVRASTAAGTTLSVPTSATTAGDLLVVSAVFETASSPATTISAVTDTAGNIYTKQASCDSSCATRVAADVWSSPGSSGGATSVTVAFNATVSAVVRVYEVSGVSAVDATATASGSSASPTTTANTSAASEFAVGVIGWAGTGSETVAPGSPWTDDPVVKVAITNYKLNEQASHAVLSTTEALTDSSTISSASWAAAIATFK